MLCIKAARANGAWWLALPGSRQLLVVDTQHIHIDLDPVEQRPRDALLVTRHHRRRAGAVFLWILPVDAWAGIQGCFDLPGPTLPHGSLGGAAGEKYAYAAQYHTLSHTRWSEVLIATDSLPDVSKTVVFETVLC